MSNSELLRIKNKQKTPYKKQKTASSYKILSLNGLMTVLGLLFLVDYTLYIICVVVGGENVLLSSYSVIPQSVISLLLAYSSTSQNSSGSEMFSMSFASSNSGAMSSASNPAMPQPMAVTRKWSSGC